LSGLFLFGTTIKKCCTNSYPSFITLQITYVFIQIKKHPFESAFYI